MGVSNLIGIPIRCSISTRTIKKAETTKRVLCLVFRLRELKHSAAAAKEMKANRYKA